MVPANKMGWPTELELAPEDPPTTHSALEETGGSALIRDQAACPFRASSTALF